MFGSFSSPSIADIAAVTGDNQNSGWGNGDGWWVLIILFALFGGWGRGGAFGGGGNGCDGACATVGDIQRGFDNQGVTNKLNGLEQGLSSIAYEALAQSNATNQGICQLGYNVQNSINGVATQMQQCCCDTQSAIAGVNYNMQSGFCNINNTIQSVARDITDNQNANYRAIHDEIVANRMEDKNAQIQSLQSQVQALNLAQSQANQNTYLISQLRPTPVPSYTVANPYAGFGYGCC